MDVPWRTRETCVTGSAPPAYHVRSDAPATHLRDDPCARGGGLGGRRWTGGRVPPRERSADRVLRRHGLAGGRRSRGNVSQRLHGRARGRLARRTPADVQRDLDRLSGRGDARSLPLRDELGRWLAAVRGRPARGGQRRPSRHDHGGGGDRPGRRPASGDAPVLPGRRAVRGGVAVGTRRRAGRAGARMAPVAASHVVRHRVGGSRRADRAARVRAAHRRPRPRAARVVGAARPMAPRARRPAPGRARALRDAGRRRDVAAGDQSRASVAQRQRRHDPQRVDPGVDGPPGAAGSAPPLRRQHLLSRARHHCVLRGPRRAVRDGRAVVLGGRVAGARLQHPPHRGLRPHRMGHVPGGRAVDRRLGGGGDGRDCHGLQRPYDDAHAPHAGAARGVPALRAARPRPAAAGAARAARAVAGRVVRAPVADVVLSAGHRLDRTRRRRPLPRRGLVGPTPPRASPAAGCRRGRRRVRPAAPGAPAGTGGHTRSRACRGRWRTP